MKNLAVFAPLLWGLTGIVGGSAVNAAEPSTVALSSARAVPVKSVANCCQDRLTGAIAKRDVETRAQCAPQIAHVDQGGGPEAREPEASSVQHQTANNAKPGR